MKKMNNPLVSVIIPAHNSSRTIGDAIESILNQTYKNTEIIIINDNSTDNTDEVVNSYVENNTNVFYYSLPYDDPNRVNKRGRNVNAGWTARNYGFTKANGEWITFQDADDVSLLNRIEIQYELSQIHKSNHVCVDWQQYKDEHVGKVLDVEKILSEHPDAIISKEELVKLSKQTKGIFHKIFGSLHSLIPFEFKRLRIINKLFFGSLAPYPGAGNSPLFKKEIIQKVKFRPYTKRVWPTFVGRGADRDFNFEVTETFKNSVVAKIPLYLWRQKEQNKDYLDYEKYIHEN